MAYAKMPARQPAAGSGFKGQEDVELQSDGSQPVTVRDRSAEDKMLSDYSLMFKYQETGQVETNINSLERPVEAFRLLLDLELLRKFLKGPRVLDFPLGSGRLYPILIDEYELYGFDISELYIERARDAYPQFAERFAVSSFETVEEPVEKFDSVYTMRVINQIKDRATVVRNIARLLAPGGRWLVNMMQYNYHDPAFTAALRENNLKVVALHRYDIHSTHGMMPPAIDYLYASIFLPLVNKGLIPTWGYRAIDRLLSRYGQYLVVVERT